MGHSIVPSVGQRPRHGHGGAPNSACGGDLGTIWTPTGTFLQHICPVPSRQAARGGSVSKNSRLGSVGLQLSVLMIRCPNTGRLISTGIETDEHSFGRIPDVLAHTRCPVCG